MVVTYAMLNNRSWDHAIWLRAAQWACNMLWYFAVVFSFVERRFFVYTVFQGEMQDAEVELR